MTMQDTENAVPTASKRLPWNKGKLTGAKPPLRPKHVWSIRTKLQVEGRIRDLAMFNLAIDSKLRGCTMPADTNQYGDIFGGWLLGQMDIAGGIFGAGIAKGERQPLLLTQ
jgi:hypothetical protein